MPHVLEPDRPEPTQRRCDVCAQHLPAYLVERGACAVCRYQRAVDDGDLREAGAIADDYALALRDGAVAPVLVLPPPAAALPVFATARERAYFLPERVSCAEAFDAARATVPVRGAA